MLMQGQLAPDFELQDTTGKKYRLSSYRGEKVIVLAFLRGFM
jgi:peroxiredoxin